VVELPICSAFPLGLRSGLAAVDVVYQTLAPPYHQWVELFPALQASVLAVAEAAGARLVSMENVYMYGRPAGQPLTETRPYVAHTKKGKLRARMARDLLAAHEAGRVQVAIGRASDYFGPRGGALSNLGDRVFPPALAGKTATVMGDPDQPHTYTYIPDIGEGLAVLGEHPDAPGEIWHLPNDPQTCTTRQLVDSIYRQAGQPRTQTPRHPGAAATSPRRHQPHRSGTRRAAVRVPGTLHRQQQQDRDQAQRPRHPTRAGPRRHPRQLPHQTQLTLDLPEA
jgi:nucleoside-diphosphate-sugar epimerase